MDPSDLDRVVQKAEELVSHLPEVQGSGHDRQGLLLGLIQSGKTVAITTSIAMAADNGYTCFVVLTPDNIWLYNQTVERLKEDLQMLEVVEKENWEQYKMFMPLDAEQALRPAVLWRKGCFGAQSAAGNQFVERFLSVAATCQAQHRDLWQFLTHAIAQSWARQPAPSLLPS
jgi:hypothetical protein